MSALVKIDINLRNGSVMEFSQPVGHGDGSVDLIQLQNSVKKVQNDCNKALTEVINKEKSDQNDSNSNKQTTQENMEDGEDDDEDDDEDVKEPADKKLKR